MADFNELAAQAIPLSQQFAQQLGEAQDFIEDIRKDADKAQETAVSRTGDIKEAIDALEAFFDSARSEIVGARESAGTKLDALETRANGVKARLEALVEAVRKGTTEVEARKRDVETAIKDQLDDARSDFEGRAAEFQALDKALQDGLAETAAALEAFRKTVAEAQAELDKKMSDWQTAVDGVGTAAAHEADEWVDKLQELMESAVGAMFTGGNNVIQAHNTAMAGMKAAFIDEAASDLETSLEPLEEELARLGTLAERRKGELPAKASQIAAKIKDVVERIETVKALMQSAERL